MQYTPLNFLRRVPNPLLERFFSRFEQFAGFDWANTKETRIAPLHERMQALPDLERRRAGSSFRQIHALADSRGTAVIVEAARDRALDLAPALQAMRSSHERAFWCFLQHPDILEDAWVLRHIEGLPKRSWEKRNGLPKGRPNLGDGTTETLGTSLSAYFLARQGRGERCKVEHRHRVGDVDSFFAYPADYAEELLGYGEDGEFERRPWNPAFEVVFDLDGGNGTLNLFAQGGRQVRDDLAQLFAGVVLGQDRKLEPWQEEAYNLDIFKNPNITFPTDPADGITSVRVRSLRVQVHGRPGGRLTFDVGGRNTTASVYEFLLAMVNESRLRLRDVTILEVNVQAVFRTTGKRSRSIPFRLSTGSACSLGDSPEERLLRRYLRTWGIEKDA